MRNRISGIYCIKNAVSGKVYVGRSVDTYGRWLHHRRNLKKGTHHNPHLQSAWSKYGEDAFTFSVIEGAHGDLVSKEQSWIAKLGSLDRSRGYNLEAASSGRGTTSEETKRKIGASNRGRKRSPEERARISAAKRGQGKGRVKSAEEIENIRKAHARRHADPEGYAWFRSPEGKAHARSAGRKGAASRWKGES